MKQLRPHLFVLCVLGLVLTTGAHTSLHNALTAMRFNWLSRAASGQIVLVAIDSPSIDRIGIWPWPRAIHADLIKVLESAGATDIAFDIDFSSPSSGADDRLFEEALKGAGGSVVLPAFKQVVRDRGKETIHVDRPLPDFAQHAWTATVNIVPDSDGIMRRYRSGEMLDGELVPSLGALLAGQYQSNATSFLIDFGINAASVPVISYADVLRGDPATINKLQGKKVIVGGTAVELADRVNVPNGHVIPGVLLQSLAAESILQGRALQISSPVVTVVGLGVVFLLMLALWRRLDAGWRAAILFALSASIELTATLIQDAQPITVDTSLFHVAAAAYLIAITLDEIDFRDLLGAVAEKRFQRIAMSLGDGLVCVDHTGKITLWNAGAKAIFGYEPEEMIGQSLDKIFARGQSPADSSWGTTELPADALQAPGGKVMELEGRRSNGETFPVEVCFSAWQGTEGINYAAVLRDISVRKREEAKIRYLASYDTLTGLANRNMLYETLQGLIESAKVEGHEAALLLLDLDKFKDINDSLGHTSGDQVLCEVAGRLNALVGEADLVSRLGGDEFAIVISGGDAVKRAQSLSEAISRSFKTDEFLVGGQRFYFRCSIGVAVFPRDCNQLHELLANADLAMFRAKAAGKGEHVFYDSALREELEHRLSLTSELELAVKRNEFELFYQPQFWLEDCRIVGVEALIRWRHPSHGLVPPSLFLPILHTTSLSDDVSLWVMKTACRQGRLWELKGHRLRVAVNLSPGQFKTGDLAATIAAVLAETEFSPSLLELEVTEDILLEDDQRVRECFHRIRDLGARIALDDFGTGYASLSYLKNFPLSGIKIDQSFVRELKSESDDAAIIEYTVRLGKRLGLSVIAEGIETQGTVDLLTRMGCEEGQGCYFGRPMPATDFGRRFLTEGPLPAHGVGSTLKLTAA